MPTSGDWTYTITSNREATLTHYNRSGQYYVAVPSTIGGYTVTNIRGQSSTYPVFEMNRMPSYFTITLPNTLTAIGSYVCYDSMGTQKLSGTLNIPSNVKSIGSYAFYNCGGITNLYLPFGLSVIGDYAFYGGRNIQNPPWQIPMTVTSIGAYAFGGCYRITGTLTIPSSVRDIGNGAFSGCYGTEALVLESENSINFTGTGAFGFGNSSHPVTVQVTGNRWIKTALANQGNDYTTFEYNVPPLPNLPLRIGSELKVYGRGYDYETEEDNVKKVIIDTDFSPDGSSLSVINVDKPTFVSNMFMVGGSKDFNTSDEEEFESISMIIAPGMAIVLNSPLNILRGVTEIQTARVDTTLTLLDENVAGHILKANESTGQVEPASSDEIFDGTGLETAYITLDEVD